MKEDISSVLKMLQEDKISSEEAEELISAIKEAPQENASPKKSSSFFGKMLKVRIKSAEKENVNVTVPVKIVKTVLKMGHGIAAAIPQAREYIEDIDMNEVIDALENGVEGKIVDIQSDEGETIEIYIE